MTKAATKTKPKPRRAAAKPKAGAAKDPLASPPDLSSLARLSPDKAATSHPAWIKKAFPSYVSARGHHADSTTRETTHKGHKVKIVTTYKVLVDGKEIQPHLTVDNGGRVYSHAMPFTNFGSALDLVCAVIDQYPEAFSKKAAASAPRKAAASAPRKHSGH